MDLSKVASKELTEELMKRGELSALVQYRDKEGICVGIHGELVTVLGLLDLAKDQVRSQINNKGGGQR